MSKFGIVSLFILGAALSWGIYVPAVHVAATQLKSNLRAFLFVGLAYFLVAVLIPSAFIFVAKYDPTQKGTPNFDMIPSLWGLFAGMLGAAGALCVIFAVVNAGKGGALYVAPLVFAGAPIINTIATILYFHPVKSLPDWRFFLGLVFAAAGAAMVMIFKPVDAPAANPTPPSAVSPAEGATGSGH